MAAHTLPARQSGERLPGHAPDISKVGGGVEQKLVLVLGVNVFPDVLDHATHVRSTGRRKKHRQIGHAKLRAEPAIGEDVSIAPELLGDGAFDRLSRIDGFGVAVDLDGEEAATALGKGKAAEIVGHQ